MFFTCTYISNYIFRTGMRPDLVLDEDDKKRRFSKLKVSEHVTEESQCEEGEVQIQCTRRKRIKSSSNQMCKKRRSESPDEAEEHSECDINMKKSVSTNLPWPQEESDAEEWLPITTMNVADDDSKYCNNVSFLDPQTGEVIRTVEETNKCIVDTCQPIPEVEQTSETQFPSNTKKETKENNVCNLVDTCAPSRIVQQFTSTSINEMKRKREHIPTGDELIMNHIHTKIDNLDNIEHNDNSIDNEYLDNKHSIKKITIYNKLNQDQQDHNGNLSSVVKRYSCFCKDSFLNFYIDF